MTHKGRFKPRNPEKYNGDRKNIIYRSGWELKYMNWLDTDDRVLEWSSEEVVIPYRDPFDRKKVRRYFPDFKARIQTKEGIETWIIEIKPMKDVEGPKPQKRKTKRYLNEVASYTLNQSKWKAAEEWCENRQYKFQIFTEKELGIK